MLIATTPPPGETETAELNRVLASECFARAAQLRRLLAYLGDNAGEGREVGEADVAREALGRRRDFDPVTDAIVRKEMGRLRRRLETYYETEGRGSAVRVQLPRGGYTIRYVRVRPGPAPSGPARRVHIAFQPLRALGGAAPEAAELLSDDLLTALVRRSSLAVAAGNGGETPALILWGIVTRPGPAQQAVRLRLSQPVSSVILWQLERTFVEPVPADQIEALTREVEAAAEAHSYAAVHGLGGYELVTVSRTEAGPGHRN